MRPTADPILGLVFTAKAVRTFCYGYLGVLIPLYLAALCLDARGIGLAVTLTLGAIAVLTLLIRRPAERHGGRAVLVALASVGAAAGVLLALARGPGLVVLAAMLGNVAVSTGETGLFLSIEQVPVARAAAGRNLTLRMSLYKPRGLRRGGPGRPCGQRICEQRPAGGQRDPGRLRPPLLALRGLRRPPGPPLLAAAGRARGGAR